MSLLDQGRDLIEIWPETIVTDEFGPRRVPGTRSFVVSCRVQPINTQDAPLGVPGAGSTYKVLARTLPGGRWAKVEWNGREFDIIGEVQASNGSNLTRHHSFLMTSRSPAAVV